MQKKQVISAFILLLFVVVSVWCTLTIPDYMNRITTLVQTQGDINEIWRSGWTMLAFALGDAACTVVIGFLGAYVASSFSAHLRSMVYNKVTGFSMENINAFSTASLVTRSTNDITQVTMVIVLGLQMLLRAPIIAVWAVIKILGKSWQWTLATVIAVVIVLLVLLVILKLVVPKFKIIQELTDSINRITRENITGVRVVRAYNAEDYQEEKFNHTNTDITATHLFIGKTMAFMLPTMQMVMNGIALSIYWIGAFMINKAPDPTEKIAIFSDMVVFMAYAIQIIMAFMFVAMIFVFLPRAQVSAVRISAVIDKEESIHDGTISDEASVNEKSGGIKGKVEFKNVTFKYPDAEAPILENISFVANPGETVAFIGSTGSGKSTLINLVPRFYDVTEGEVLIDNINVKDYTQKALHDKIGYVSQKAVLFKGTIASNVGYGWSEGYTPSEEDIIHAIELAEGKNIIDAEEKGIYAEVAQGGTNFSGGQKQRIAIARAICSKPEIFVFDDSFSALDYKTDKILRSNLKRETKDSTSLIVAQRIGTVMDADRIVVLNEGKVVGIGKHEELMKTCEVYQQIAYSQLSKEEMS